MVSLHRRSGHATDQHLPTAVFFRCRDVELSVPRRISSVSYLVGLLTGTSHYHAVTPPPSLYTLWYHVPCSSDFKAERQIRTLGRLWLISQTSSTRPPEASQQKLCDQKQQTEAENASVASSLPYLQDPKGNSGKCQIVETSDGLSTEC